MTVAPGMYKFWDYDKIFFERYCTYDEDGDLIGVKDNAPSDFKKAFKEYTAEKKKIREVAEAEGCLII